MREYKTGKCNDCGHEATMSVMRMGTEHTLLCVSCYSKKNKVKMESRFGRVTLCPECLVSLDLRKDTIRIWNGKPLCDACYRIKIASRKL